MPRRGGGDATNHRFQLHSCLRDPRSTRFGCRRASVGRALARGFAADPARKGFEVSGTWELSNTFDIRIGWSDAHTRPRSVVSSPFWSDYTSRGYSLAISQRAFGPFELYGRVEVVDVDVATASTLKSALADGRRRITIAGASARWRPTSDRWGFEAGANRATDRPTFDGIGVFISF